MSLSLLDAHQLELAWRDAGLLDRFGALNAAALNCLASTLELVESDRSKIRMAISDAALYTEPFVPSIDRASAGGDRPVG